MNRRERLHLVALLAIALAVIGWGIWRVAPHQLNGDEWSAVGKALLLLFHEPVTDNFRKGGNFHLRLLSMAFIPLAGWWLATGRLDPMLDASFGFGTNIPLVPGPTLDGFHQAVFVGRSVSVLAAIGTVYVVYLLARETASHRAGLIAGLTLIAMPGFTSLAKFANEDAPQLFLVMLTLYLLVLAVDRDDDSRLAIAAVTFGLAVSMKATSGLLLIPGILAVHSVEWRHRREARHLLESAGLYTTLASIAYFATTPSALVFPTRWLASILAYIGLSMTNAPVTSGITYTVPPATVAGVHFTRSLGGFLALVAVVAVAILTVGLARRRYDRRLVLVLAFAIPYALVLLTPRMPQYPRLILLHPPIAIAIGVVLADGFEAFPHRFKSLDTPTGSGALLASVIVALTLVSTAAFVADFGTSRAQATDWLDANAEPGDEIDAYGYRVYAPEAPPEATVWRPLLNDPANDTATDRAIERVQMRCPRYVVLSSYYYGRFLNQPEKWPAESHHIEVLLFGASGYREAARFGPPPLRDYSWKAKFWRSFNYPPTWLWGDANPTIVILERAGEPASTC